MSYYSEQLTDFIARLEIKADSVLDIGSSQKKVFDRTKGWDVKEYITLDLEVPHEGEKSDIVWDINEKSGIRKDLYETFDIAFCLEVMEYIYDPVNALSIVCGFLRKGGELYISFPFVYCIHKPVKNDYLRYTRMGAIKLLENAGFEIEMIMDRVAKDPEKLRDFYKSDGMHVGGDSNVTGFIIKAIKR